MRSILYPDGDLPKPFWSNNSDDFYTLIAVSLFLIIVFWVYIFWILYSGIAKTNILTACPAGQCATTLSGGDKRCPLTLDQTIFVNPSLEVCNPPTFCTHRQTPYAVNADNSINISGVCEDQSICACTNKNSCPWYTMTVFTQQPNGVYPQQAAGNIATGGTLMPIADNQTCVLDTTNLAKIGCNGINPVTCVQQNPCLAGVLTFIPEFGISPTAFVEQNNYSRSVVGCLAGQICSQQQVSVYNFATGSAECVNLDL